ncbi:LysE family translocator [Undibacterium luofuense]|uniref:LysE family translocator n=1 Tax=Undibacterium luofuense TaxID=2828733 RepID=UPI0030EBDF9D
MNYQSLALFTLTEAALSLSPGPAVMMVITCALTQGWRRSVYATLGILSGNAIYFALSASGISGVILSAPGLFVTIKYLGALYLAYLGISALTGRPSPLTISQLKRTSQSPVSIYLQALMLQLTNPKTLLMFIAILPQFVDVSQPVSYQILLLAICSIIPEWFILLGYGIAASRTRHLIAEEKYALITERVAGSLVLFAALMVVIN